MAIDFKHFDAEQADSLLSLAAHLVENPPKLVEYHGGFLPTAIYMQLQKEDKLKNINVAAIPRTQLGAKLSNIVSIITGGTLAAIKDRQDVDFDVRAEACEAVRTASSFVCVLIAKESTPELFERWKAHCRNVPEDASEEFMQVMFVTEMLDSATLKLAPDMNAALGLSQSGNGNATLH